MGNYEEDQEERQRMLRKQFADKQYIDCVETIAEAAPDVAVANLIAPAVAGASGGVGGAAAVLISGPVGILALGACATGGALLGGKAQDAYRAASTEDRARVRSLGKKAGMTGAAGWKIGSVIVKLAK